MVGSDTASGAVPPPDCELNPHVKAFALRTILTVDPRCEFVFRWTTNNPWLPPDLTLSYRFDADRLQVRYGPFGAQDGVLGLLASMRIHQDHLDQAITTPEHELADAPWPAMSVVTLSRQMLPMLEAYAEKYPQFPVPTHMSRPGR